MVRTARKSNGFWCLVLLLTGQLLLTGCQKLFHEQDALLKGQTVRVAVTVPETPLPAVQPLAAAPGSPPAAAAPGRLDPQLLPGPAASAAVAPLLAPQRTSPVTPGRAVLTRADTVIAGKTVTEDLSLRGTVLITGSLVVAPQATLKIEPGAVVRFAAEPVSGLPSRLVVQGRLVVAGTAQQPVLLAPAQLEPQAGDWGGLLLLGSEKKNSLEQCRIEGAATAVTAHFSRVSAKGLTITRCRTGIELSDAEASLQGLDIRRCDIGLHLSDSELDLRDSLLQENRLGMLAHRASFTVHGTTWLTQAQEGALFEDSRFRISNSLFSGNRIGLRMTGGDGQLFLSGFTDQREHGAALQGGRVRIRNCSFSGNAAAGLQLEQTRGMLTGSTFSDNRGGNLHSLGHEPFSAVLNWWGSADYRTVAAGILTNTRPVPETIPFVPFLIERPATAP